MVRGSSIKPGAVIIDVGINPVEVSRHLVFCIILNYIFDANLSLPSYFGIYSSLKNL